MEEPNSSPNQIAQVYQSLPVNDNTIRVLDILPGRKEDHLQVRLRNLNLNSNPRYDALSYTWGKSLE